MCLSLGNSICVCVGDEGVDDDAREGIYVCMCEGPTNSGINQIHYSSSKKRGWIVICSG